MKEKYKNIKRAPVIRVNEHAEEISVLSFPEGIQIYLDTYQPGDLSFSEKHWHHSLQFNVILEGSLELSVNDSNITLQPGDGVFINKNVLHCLNPNGTSACICYSFQIPPSAICPEKDIHLFEKYVTPVIDSKSFSYLYLERMEEKKRRILEYLDRAFHMAEEKEFAYELKVKSSLLELWIILLEYLNSEMTMEKQTDSISSAGAERMKEMMTFVQSHYSEKISLGDIADAASVSASECSRVFRRFLNTTPIDYLTQVRIAKACNRLRKEGEKPSAVGEEVGFTDYSYFHRVFKKYMRCTPKEYQKTFTGKEEV